MAKYQKYQAIDWSTERLDGCIHFLSYYNRAVFEHLRRYFSEFTVTVSRHRKNLTVWHYNEAELEAVYRRALNRFIRQPKFFTRLQKEWRMGVKQFQKHYRLLSHKKLKQLSNNGLIKAHKQFYDFAERTIYIPFFIEGLTVGRRKLIDEGLRQWAAEHGHEQYYGKIYQTLTTPGKPSFVTRAHLDLLRLVQSGVVSTQRLLSYQRKYIWLRNNYYAAVPFTLAEIRREWQAVLKKKISLQAQARAIFNPVKIKQAKAQILKRFSLPLDLRRQLAWLAHLTNWQDERKQIVLMIIQIANRFLIEAERRTGISLLNLKNSFSHEYGAIVRGRLKSSYLKKRGNSLVFWQALGVKVLVGREAVVADKAIFNQAVDLTVKTIAGIGASAGRVCGPVKIMLSSRQGAKLKKGDILVAGMTRPDYIQAMRRASAIVTDEGGITCHAAIISRELGIPCVVGTKIATQALKDGDKVEVDADKGTIRKL